MNHKDAHLQKPRPYIIAYIRGDRRLGDSAQTLDGAKARIERRLAKRYNRGERAEVFCGGALVYARTV